MNAPTRDYYDDVDDLRAAGEGWKDEEVRNVQGRRVVPFRCRDCHRPAYYDHADDQYHHAAEPSRGCFLIPAEDRDPDPRHPDLFSWEPKAGDRFRYLSEHPWHVDLDRGTHRFLLLCEVTETDGVGLSYRVVEVLEEEDRPPFTPRDMSTGSGGIARFVLPDYAATGVLKVLP